MTEPSVARRTLAKARFFVDQAELVGIADREALEAHLEAAIVFGRTVTFHIQNEYCHRPGFKPWYSVLQTKMKEDSIFRFFLNTRNFILKEGPVGVGRVISFSGQVTVVPSVSAEVRLIFGKPWYRRSLKILWEDLRAEVLRPIHKWRQRREIARRRARAQQQLGAKATDDNFYFHDSAWSARPALELLREYLTKLEAIVDEAEARFQGGS